MREILDELLKREEVQGWRCKYAKWISRRTTCGMDFDMF